VSLFVCSIDPLWHDAYVFHKYISTSKNIVMLLFAANSGQLLPSECSPYKTLEGFRKLLQFHFECSVIALNLMCISCLY